MIRNAEMSPLDTAPGRLVVCAHVKGLLYLSVCTAPHPHPFGCTLLCKVKNAANRCVRLCTYCVRITHKAGLCFHSSPGCFCRSLLQSFTTLPRLVMPSRVGHMNADTAVHTWAHA